MPKMEKILYRDSKEWLTVYSYLEFLCNFAVSGHIHIHLFAQCDHIKQ